MTHEETIALVSRYLARYRIIIPRLMSFDPNNALVALRKLGRVDYFTQNYDSRRLLPGGVSYARLTKEGCEFEGVPVERSSPKINPDDIAIFWHCETQDQIRMEVAEVESFIGWKPPPNVACVLSPTGLARVYIATASESTIVYQLGKILDRLPEHVGILALAPTAQKCAAIKTALKESKHNIPVEVMLGPSPDTLGGYLDDRRRKSSNP